MCDLYMLPFISLTRPTLLSQLQGNWQQSAAPFNSLRSRLALNGHHMVEGGDKDANVALLNILSGLVESVDQGKDREAALAAQAMAR